LEATTSFVVADVERGRSVFAGDPSSSEIQKHAKVLDVMGMPRMALTVMLLP
jgi:hypothetical protein